MLAVVAVISSKVAFEAFIFPFISTLPPTFKPEAIVAKSAVKVANDDIPETVNDVIFAEVNLAFVASNIEIAACKAFIWPVVIFLPIEVIYWDRFSDTLSNEADMALIWFDKSWMSCLVAIFFSWLNKLFVCSLSENIFLISKFPLFLLDLLCISFEQKEHMLIGILRIHLHMSHILH